MLEVVFQIYINIDPIYLWGINSGKALNEKVLFQKKGLQISKSWCKVLCFEQGGVKTWKKVRQNTSILPEALSPELPYEVDFFKKSGSKKIDRNTLFWEVILGDSQEILLKELTERLRIRRKNVAMVLIKLLPNTF